MATRIVTLYRRLSRWPAGRWLFSRAVCLKAPYFATIAPTVTALKSGRCEVRMRDRRRVRNHIGTVHAIALCNMAELAGGLVTDASLPPGMRWIPKGMSVHYLAKARGTLTATATPEVEPAARDTGYELPVVVEVTNATGEPVFSARISMWLSPLRPSLREAGNA